MEKSATSVPSPEAVATIDDVLSMAKSVKFYGKTTKTYRNPKDKELSGAYCTIPVRYDFKDKNTRIQSETVLRERCKIQCSTPYPLILRECIKRVVDKVKSDFPEDVVRVNIDIENFALKVARKPPGAAEWERKKNPIPLPSSALDVNARKLPEDFVFEFSTPNSPRESRREAFENKQPDNEKNNSPTKKSGQAAGTS